MNGDVLEGQLKVSICLLKMILYLLSKSRIFMKYVSRQEETDDIGAEAGGADRGHLGHRSGESAIHCAATERDYYLHYFVKSNPGRTVRFCNSNCVRVSGGSLTPSPFLVSTPFPFTPSSIRSSFSRTWTGSPPARTSS